MIYLCSAYSHPSAAVRQQRFELVRDVTLRLIKAGHVVFSPITYSHQFSNDIGTEFGPWEVFDMSMINLALQVWVLATDGWQESVGTRKEIAVARSIRIPVGLIDPDTLKVSKLT